MQIHTVAAAADGAVGHLEIACAIYAFAPLVVFDGTAGHVKDSASAHIYAPFIAADFAAVQVKGTGVVVVQIYACFPISADLTAVQVKDATLEHLYAGRDAINSCITGMRNLTSILAVFQRQLAAVLDSKHRIRRVVARCSFACNSLTVQAMVTLPLIAIAYSTVILSFR